MPIEISTSSPYTGLLYNSGIKTSGGEWITNTTIDTAAGGFSGTYTLLKQDTILNVIGSTVNCIINLGAVTVSDNGRTVIIKNNATSATVSVSDIIDSIANRKLYPKDSMVIIYDGASWKISGIYRNIETKETSVFPYTIKSESYLICTGTGDVTLPLASSVAQDKPIIIKNIGGGTITVYPSSPNTIDTNPDQKIHAKQSYSFFPYSSGYILI